jgi:hypothetical protein
VVCHALEDRDFSQILKSGCKAEESKLRTAERIINLVAVLCILSWRIFWVTMMNRVSPSAASHLAFTPLELQLLDQLITNKNGADPPAESLSTYIVKMARLGGYLARPHDGPPGNTVLWRGISRLTDIQLGFLLGAQLWVIKCSPDAYDLSSTQFPSGNGVASSSSPVSRSTQ